MKVTLTYVPPKPPYLPTWRCRAEYRLHYVEQLAREEIHEAAEDARRESAARCDRMIQQLYWGPCWIGAACITAAKLS